MEHRAVGFIREMDAPRRRIFPKRSWWNHIPEVGQIATEYNRVLNRVNDEIQHREHAIQALQKP